MYDEWWVDAPDDVAYRVGLFTAACYDNRDDHWWRNSNGNDYDRGRRIGALLRPYTDTAE